MKVNGRDNSFSSNDDLPLKNYAGYTLDPNNSYKSLRRRVKVECEFCDRTFNNRYQGLIHNASHIIIPLINQNVLECDYCRFCYTSYTDLETHISQTHPTPATRLKKSEKKGIKIRNLIEFEEKNLITLPDLLTDLTNNCSVTLNRSLGETKTRKKSKEKFKEEYDQSLKERIESPDQNSVDCNPEDSNEGLVNGTDDVLIYTPSVHYDEVRRPMPVRCKYCKKIFKDRYDLAVHQICHMRINHRRIYTRITPESKREPKIWLETHSPTPPPKRSDCVIQICDLCYGFLRPKSHLRYTRKGTVSLPGKRARCNMCDRKFFELNMVVRTKIVYKRREKGCRKRLTNDQRLKNIRHRLKAANKALKWWFLFHFFPVCQFLECTVPGCSPF